MHSIQGQAKREFGGWMDGGIRIIWSRYLLRLLAKKKKIIRNRRNYLKQKILFTKNLQQRELFYYKDLVQWSLATIADENILSCVTKNFSKCLCKNDCLMCKVLLNERTKSIDSKKPILE